MSIDKITLEVLNNHFRAIVEDMARVIQRTAFTTFVKETADFSAGLISLSGEYVAFPWNLGATGFIGTNFIKTINAIPSYDEGDIILMNDPYTGFGPCTHLPDLHLLKPIFDRGEIVAYAYAFIHSSDVGGTVPASVWPRASELFQEGLRLRPAKLFRAGVLNVDLMNVLADNSRIPEMNWGDVNSMVAAVNTCERRLRETIAKFGRETVQGAITALLDHAEERSRAVLANIPDGSYSFVDYMEDDMVSDVPIRLEVTINARGGSVHLDYTGTDPQVASALNVPTGGGTTPLAALSLIAYIFTEDPDMPRIGSILRPVKMTLPYGSVINPAFPAACGVRWGTVIRLADTVVGALNKAIPGKVPAASAGSISPIVCSLLDLRTGGRHVTVIQPLMGGGGGWSNGDGVDGCEPISGNTRNTPVESIEADIPIVIRRYHLIQDSGGAGRYRGGLATRLDFQVFHPDTIVTARGMERFKIQPWGTAGGFCGANGAAVINPDGSARPIGKIDSLRLQPGDVLSVRAPAGGGYGDPLDREPDLVRADVSSHFVSNEAARDQYGVVLREGIVDENQTGQLRARLRRERGARPIFDYGSFRLSLEERWPLDVSGECARLVGSLPPSVRDYVKHRLFESIQLVSATRRPQIGDLKGAWDSVMTQLQRALA